MLYLFDIDGTLIQSFIRESPQKHGSELEATVYDRVLLLPGRLERIRELASGGARFGLVTNQGGVAFGYQTPMQVMSKLAHVTLQLHFFFGQPYSLHWCFEHPKAKCGSWLHPNPPRRKPNPGMLLEAMRAHFDVTMEASQVLYEVVYVGDMDSDRQAAQRLGVRYRDAGEFFV